MIGGVGLSPRLIEEGVTLQCQKITMGNNQTKPDGTKFETLFNKNVPHILEKIFYSLDYNSFMESKKVCKAWNILLSSKSYDEMAIKMQKEKRDHNELCQASYIGTLDDVRHILRNGVNPNCTGTARSYGMPLDKITPIQYALFGSSSKKEKDKVKLLIRGGADPTKNSTMDREEVSALSFAVMHKSKDVIEALLEGGSDPNVCNIDGESLLSYAVMYNSKDVVKVLLEAGSDPNFCNIEGESPLLQVVSLAKENRNPTIDNLKLLLEAGSDPNKADNEGRTPLHFATRYDEIILVRMLLDGGAKPTAGSSTSTPLWYAKRNGNKDMQGMLLSKMSRWECVKETLGCITSYDDGSFGSPLFYCAIGANVLLISLLSALLLSSLPDET